MLSDSVSPFPPSPATATFCHTIVRAEPVTKFVSGVQPVTPEGPVTDVVVVFSVANSTRASPGCTPAGTVSVALVVFPTNRARPRNAIGLVVEETVTGWETESVAPFPSVTVSVTVYVPACW